MKSIKGWKYLDHTVLISTALVNLLFTIIVYSMRLESKYYSISSMWSAVTFYSGESTVLYFCTGFVFLFFVSLMALVASIVVFLFTKKKIGFYIWIPFHLCLSFSILLVHLLYRMLGSGAIACLILGILVLGAGLIYLLKRRVKAEKPNEEEVQENPVNVKLYKTILLVFEGITLGILVSIFLIPLYQNVNQQTFTSTSYILIDALVNTRFPSYLYVIFILFFVAFFVCCIQFITSLTYYFKTNHEFVLKAKRSIYSNAAITLVFFIVGYIMCFYNNIKQGQATTVSYIPLLLSLLVLVAFSIIQGKMGLGFEAPERIDTKKSKRVEPLIFVIILTLITFLSLFFNIIEVHLFVGLLKSSVVLSGYELLTKYQSLGAGYQILSFAMFASLLLSVILLVTCIVSFFAKYKEYYKVIKMSAYANVIFMLLLGLFGFYFQIAQKINEDNITTLLALHNINVPLEYTYSISSQVIYVFAVSFAVFIIMIIRGALNGDPELPVLDITAEVSATKPSASEAGNVVNPSTPGAIGDFDACPAFTEIDQKIPEFEERLAERRRQLFENLTLPNLVHFIVNYAKESRLHLSYTAEDIATFVAGLGASRLAILQGMSGTGKTSLPKIFAEAILGNCEIVEVESSWRDKNELIGYYNEFSKCFTPKKFTQSLYKARLNSSVPTFIVLDEMNLSRIEYYFSDFLSLMENEEDKREMKLLNIKLARTEDGVSYTYAGLKEGHTIQIPANIWFIGTANKDESTFVISDKVYDRAQTMNFNKRAPKIHSYGEPLAPKFVPYDALNQLFVEAKEHIQFEAEDNAIIQKVEALLVPYNISFGNRILKQMEEFVKIYCACLRDDKSALTDGIERILLSKVVSKLEYKIVEDKESLAQDFDKLGLKACSSFIRSLNED